MFTLLFIEIDVEIRCGILDFSVSHSNSLILIGIAGEIATVLILNIAVLIKYQHISVMLAELLSKYSARCNHSLASFF